MNANGDSPDGLRNEDELRPIDETPDSSGAAEEVNAENDASLGPWSPEKEPQEPGATLQETDFDGIGELADTPVELELDRSPNASGEQLVEVDSAETVELQEPAAEEEDPAVPAESLEPVGQPDAIASATGTQPTEIQPTESDEAVERAQIDSARDTQVSRKRGVKKPLRSAITVSYRLFAVLLAILLVLCTLAPALFYTWVKVSSAQKEQSAAEQREHEAVETMQAAVVERDKANSERDAAATAEKDAIQEKEDAVAEKNAAVELKDMALQTRDQAVQEKDAALMEKEQAVEVARMAEAAKKEAVVEAEGSAEKASQAAQMAQIARQEASLVREQNQLLGGLVSGAGAVDLSHSAELLDAVEQNSSDAPSEKALNLGRLAIRLAVQMQSAGDAAGVSSALDTALASANQVEQIANQNQDLTQRLNALYLIARVHELRKEYGKALEKYREGANLGGNDRQAVSRFQAAIVRVSVLQLDGQQASLKRQSMFNVLAFPQIVAMVTDQWWLVLASQVAAPANSRESQLRALVTLAQQAVDGSGGAPGALLSLAQAHIRFAEYLQANKQNSIASYDQALDALRKAVEKYNRTPKNELDDLDGTLLPQVFAEFDRAAESLLRADAGELVEQYRDEIAKLRGSDERWAEFAREVGRQAGSERSLPSVRWTSDSARQDTINWLANTEKLVRDLRERHDLYEPADRLRQVAADERDRARRVESDWADFVTNLAKSMGYDEPLPSDEQRWRADAAVVKSLDAWKERARAVMSTAIEQDPITEAASHVYYGDGLHAFYRGDFEDAHELFTLAIEMHATDARYFYFRALAEYCSVNGDQTSAVNDMKAGVALEQRDRPRSDQVQRALERIQGRPRMWFESTRKELRLDLAGKFAGSNG